MAKFSFADWYRKAGINPERERIQLREKSFKGLLGQLSTEQIVDLGRIYFGLPDPSGNGFDWFSSAFSENDHSFGMLDNEREAALLAACLLAASMEDGDPEAGLAVLCFSAANHRTPLVLGELVADLAEDLDSYAIDQRARAQIDVDSIKAPNPGKTVPIAANVAEDNESLVKAFKQLHETSYAPVAQVVPQVRAVISPLLKELTDLREEVDILWWHIAGWSDILDQSYAESDIASAAVFCGIELAARTISPPGGVAARALLRRTIMAGRAGRKGKGSGTVVVTLLQSVGAFPRNRHEYLPHPGAISRNLDACPVLSAFNRAVSIGPSPAWHEVYEKSTHLRPDLSFTPLDLGLQAYRESMLLSMLE